VARDQLFTTLTTTTRRLPLTSGRPSLWSDTVGFVEQLPHHLVAAFQSTLREAAEADLTLVVLEAQQEDLVRHQEVVEEAPELGVPPSRRLPVLSKVNLLGPQAREELRETFPNLLQISSHTGEGLAELLTAVETRHPPRGFVPTCISGLQPFWRCTSFRAPSEVIPVRFTS
jgi:GTP-binding protein HflX